MGEVEAIAKALLITALSILATILVPSFEQVTTRALVTARDQASRTGVYDASFNPGFNAAITGARLAGFIKTVLELLAAIAVITTVIARKIM